MTLTSMTGFARSDGLDHDHRWTWEARSVNGKGLDLRIRLPAGFERLEPRVRQRCAASLSRGNVQLSLVVTADVAGHRVKVNEDVLASLLSAMERVSGRMVVRPPSLDGIFSIRGVVEIEEADLDAARRDELDAALLAGLDRALADLVAMRVTEGGALASALSSRLDEMTRLTTAAEASPAREPAAIRARLAEQIAVLLDAAPALDPDRLHQEAVLLAGKADIREELDRIGAHIAAARDLLGQDGPVGRRLDFLAQEFNREVNTLCAKSNDRALTAIGLEMKAVVDQMREQIQNVE